MRWRVRYKLVTALHIISSTTSLDSIKSVTYGFQVSLLKCTRAQEHQSNLVKIYQRVLARYINEAEGFLSKEQSQEMKSGSMTLNHNPNDIIWSGNTWITMYGKIQGSTFLGKGDDDNILGTQIVYTVTLPGKRIDRQQYWLQRTYRTYIEHIETSNSHQTQKPTVETSVIAAQQYTSTYGRPLQ